MTIKFTPASDLHHIWAHSHLYTANTDPAADADEASTVVQCICINPNYATHTSHPEEDATTNATDVASHSKDVTARSTANAAAC